MQSYLRCSLFGSDYFRYYIVAELADMWQWEIQLKHWYQPTIRQTCCNAYLQCCPVTLSSENPRMWGSCSAVVMLGHFSFTKHLFIRSLFEESYSWRQCCLSFIGERITILAYKEILACVGAAIIWDALQRITCKSMYLHNGLLWNIDYHTTPQPCTINASHPILIW